MRVPLSIFFGALCCICCSAQPIMAQEAPPGDWQAMQGQMTRMQETLAHFESLLRDQNERIAALEQTNIQLRSQIQDSIGAPMPPVPVEISKSQPATPKPRHSPGSRRISGPSNLLNPEIGVLTDVVTNITEDSLDAEGQDRVAVRELEFIYGAYIDPYSRLDVTGAINDFENFEIENAYITHYGLPWEIKGELGRFRPKIGKAASMHRDSLETVDEPLLVRKYFGEEGYFRTGAGVSKVCEMPWDLTGEITTGIVEGGMGEGGTAFGSSRRRPTFFSHWKTFKEFSDLTDVEIGATHMAGSASQRDRFDVNILGFDATLQHRPTPESKIKWQSEAYLQNRRHAFTFSGEGDYIVLDRYPWGFYSLLDYRLTPRWEIGVRADAVQPVANLGGNRRFETSWSAYLTFHQSEFARWRTQFRHTDFSGGGDDNTVFLQGTVAIGQHKHKLQ